VGVPNTTICGTAKRTANSFGVSVKAIAVPHEGLWYSASAPEPPRPVEPPFLLTRRSRGLRFFDAASKLVHRDAVISAARRQLLVPFLAADCGLGLGPGRRIRSRWRVDFVLFAEEKFEYFSPAPHHQAKSRPCAQVPQW
jgi:hypothetical protein